MEWASNIVAFITTGRVADLGLGDKQMKVLRHDYISVDYETVLTARLFQDCQNKSRRQAEPNFDWRWQQLPVMKCRSCVP